MGSNVFHCAFTGNGSFPLVSLQQRACHHMFRMGGGGRTRDTRPAVPPPLRAKMSIFMQFWGKFGQIVD